MSTTDEDEVDEEKKKKKDDGLGLMASLLEMTLGVSGDMSAEV
jgi:hypothetical protein